MKKIISSLLVYSLTISSAQSATVRLMDSNSSDIMDGVFDDSYSAKIVGKYNTMQVGLSISAGFNMSERSQPIPSEDKCDDGLESKNFGNEIYSNLISTGKKCSDNLLDIDEYRYKYCECLASDKMNTMGSKKIERIMEKVASEAKKKQGFYLNASLQVMQDKVLNTVETYYKYKDVLKDKITCEPQTLLKNFDNAAKDCGASATSKIEKMTQTNNIFPRLAQTFKNIDNEFKAKPSFKNAFSVEQVTSRIAKLLKKVNDNNNDSQVLTPSEYQKTSKMLKTVLKKSPILRKFSIRIKDQNGVFQTINNNPDLFASGRITQKDLIDTIADNLMMYSANQDRNTSIDIDSITKGFSNIANDELASINSLCNSITSYVHHMCNSVEDSQPNMVKVIQDPLHLAQIINDLEYKQIHGKTRSEDMSDMVDNLGRSFLTGEFAMGKQRLSSKEQTANNTLNDMVGSLQCYAHYPKFRKDFSPFALIDGNKIEKKYGDIFSQLELNSAFIGLSNSDKNISASALFYDPNRDLASVMQWSQSIVDDIQKENGLSEETELYLVPKSYDAQYRTRYNKIPTSRTSEAIGTGGAIKVDEQQLIPPISRSSQPKETVQASVNQNIQAPTQQAAITQLSSISPVAVKVQEKAVAVQAPTTKNTEDTLKEYEQRMQQMMAQMAVIAAQKATQSKIDTPKSVEVMGELEKDEKELQTTIDDLKKEMAELNRSQSKTKTVARQSPGATGLKSTEFSPVATQANSSSTAAKAQQASPSKGGSTASAVRQQRPQQASSGSRVTSVSSGTSSSGTSFALKSERVNLDGKFVVSAKEFNPNDRANMAALFEKSGGQPIYVTKQLEDGTEEVVKYEAEKDEFGNIIYKEKEILDIVDPKLKVKAKTKKKLNKTSNRKRTKVEDLNKLIDKNK